MTPRKLAVEALLQLRDKGPVDQSCGICANVEEKITCAMGLSRKQSEGAYRIVENAMREWPKFSGDAGFPIQGGEKAYLDAKDGTMWGKKNSYGALRWELLDWLIETLEKDNES